MSATPIRGRLTSNLIPLKEHNGAPRSEEERMTAIVQAAVSALIVPMEARHREQVAEIQKLAQKMSAGYEKLAASIDAFTIGEDDVAVAAIVDHESEDLPNLSSYKAEATVLYKLKASDIASALGAKTGIVGYLLGANGLNWSERKPKLWNPEFFRMTKRRLWHRDVIKLLSEVALDVDHLEREGITAACENRLDELARLIRAKAKSSKAK